MNRARSKNGSGIGKIASIGLLLAAGMALLFLFRPASREDVVERALKIADKNPAESERLLRRVPSSDAAENSAAFLSLAWLCGRKGEWNEARTFLARVDASSCRPDLLVKFGREAMLANQYALAVKALEPLRSRVVPERAEALEMLWKIYPVQGTYDDAIAVAHALLEIQPKNHSLRLELIKALKGAFKEVECLEEIRTALKYDVPRNVKIELEFLLIDQLMVLGDVRQAWKEVEALEQLAGKSPQLQSKVIDLLRTEGRLNEALTAVTELFPRVQQMPAAYLTRGVLYLDLRRFEEAASDLQRVIAAEPFNEGAHFKLSEAFRNMGQDELARKHREIGVDIRQKRIRIIALIKQQSSSTLSRSDCEELSMLNGQLGAAEASRYWHQRAEFTDRLSD